MGSHISPVVLRREIGRRIRLARQGADLTIIEAADRLEITRSRLSRFENGESSISVHLVRSMMDTYDERLDDVVDMIRQARAPGWWKRYGVSDKSYIALETAASRTSEYHLAVVTGLLQTEDYATAVFRSGRETRPDEWIANQVRIRMARQARLTDEEHPLEVDTVVHELALRQPVGGPAVMRAQLHKLALINELPTVTLRILPISHYTYESGYGGFTILDFPSASQPSVAFVQHSINSDRQDKPEYVEPARQRFAFLRSLALNPDESVALIERINDELWAKQPRWLAEIAD